jgi:hypothetical protein
MSYIGALYLDVKWEDLKIKRTLMRYIVSTAISSGVIAAIILSECTMTAKPV